MKGSGGEGRRKKSGGRGGGREKTHEIIKGRVGIINCGQRAFRVIVFLK
jgi:hypothetical protein